MAGATAWLKGERATDFSYWSEKPGCGQFTGIRPEEAG
jgi:hypothetical protein